ncbi:Zn(2)-C6 fungal-type domain-containing protein [Pseudozyma hubeiensis]|nr:Zn(2)-C6 fungal-type domain-containing protein [Pseudozyma hubeiensis]
MSSADAADFGFKRFRVAKACVVCRLRKTKCNGEQPCDRCKAHSAECKYETIESPLPKRIGRTGSNSSIPNTNRSSQPRDNNDDANSDDASSAHASAADAAAEARAAKRQKRAMIDQIADRRWGDRLPSRSNSSRKSGYVQHHLELYASVEQDEPTDHDPDLHTEDGIRAHDQNTGNMQFYGFTSNFNFQHRLAQTVEALRLREQHQHASGSTSRANASHEAPLGASDRNRRSHLPESMKIWGHQDIIFRQSPSEKSFPTLDACQEAVGDSTFLPPSIVDRFIENYMTLIQPQLGAVPKRQIVKWVKDAKALGHLSRGFSGVPSMAASGPGNQGKLQPGQPGQKLGPAPMRTNELAALYVVLALGALMDEGDWEDCFAPVSLTREGAIACATTLFLLAKKRLEEIVENSSIQSARCLVLMSFFSLQWSSPNVAYLYIGYAARMCISIGLHRETFHSPGNPRSAEHRQLWWTCYGIERMISTWFGQASAIRDDDVSARLPQPDNSYDAYLLVYAQIARVCSDMGRLSANPPANAHDVLLASERMEAEMLRIRHDAPKELAIGLRDGFTRDADDDSDSSDLVVRRYSVTILWWYLRLLIHSPLVIFALYCRSIGTDIPRSVLDKTHTSARAGQQIIDAISNARSDMPRPGLDNMRFGSFYLDSACTIVLAAILCEPSNQELAFGYLAAIDRAIKYLEKKERIYADHGTTASLHKARDLVVLARQVVRAAAGQSASSKVHDQQNAARGRAAASTVSANGAAHVTGIAADASGRASQIGISRPTSTFSTSSERGTASAEADGIEVDVQSAPKDGAGALRRNPFSSHLDGEGRGHRGSPSDLSVSSLLGPTPTASGTAYRPQSSTTSPAAAMASEPATAEGKSFANERDEWMQYFLSNFDWLSQPPGTTPQALQSNSNGTNMSPAFSAAGTPDTLGRFFQNQLAGKGGMPMVSPGLSSPGSAGGPASLSDLDIGLLMGGVSVMEGVTDLTANGAAAGVGDSSAGDAAQSRYQS